MLIKPQVSKWPVETHGKWTAKTNMATMRAVLLDESLGFIIRSPSASTGGYINEDTAPSEHIERELELPSAVNDRDAITTTTGGVEPPQPPALHVNTNYSG